ncbi:DUF4391 domain-containing protein [Clostridium sp. 3-3]|uniref:DUF4391 domain-containing protein n=1 Tax=Clostridium sp. 3-3 TaxID=2070757 RepID=UPI000CDA73E5|nr:DUF4391 domain-containing protein [Clostridium sp. 3-3]POO87834.1 DUF4391 domain-containing protein [Clostridium sp. 3-3]
MIDEFYENMNLPKECRIDSTIFKKVFYENANMNSLDKDIFKKDIDKIILRYSLKEENINVPSYKDDEIDYEEIEIIEVNLVSSNKYKRVCEIIQKAIPYPLIIVLTIDNKILINTAYKRINKNDEEKNTVEEYAFTSWIDGEDIKENEELFFKCLNIRNLSFTNMYKLYCSFVEKINILNASKFTGDFNNLEIKDIEEVNKLNEEINCIDDEINKLKITIKKEVQFNKRMDINIKIKKLETKRNKLIEELKS